MATKFSITYYESDLQTELELKIEEAKTNLEVYYKASEICIYLNKEKPKTLDEARVIVALFEEYISKFTF